MSAVVPQLAIMGKVHFGMRDMPFPAFWFEVSFGEDLSSGSLIIVSPERMCKIVEEASVYDIEHLEGAPCQVTSAGWGSTVEFVKVLKR